MNINQNFSNQITNTKQNQPLNLNTRPYFVMNWKDTNHTTAEGWLVVDSIIDNRTGGGCIMSPYLTEKIITEKAAIQSKKMILCYPPIGGAKAGIRFPMQDPRAPQVLARFIEHFRCLLDQLWIFAGDLSGNCYSMFINCLSEANIRLRFSPALVLSRYSLLPLTLDKVAGGYGVSEVIKTLKFLSPDKYNSCPSVAIYGIDFYSLTLAYFLETKSIAKVVAIGDSSGVIYDTNGLHLSQFMYQLQNVLNYDQVSHNKRPLLFCQKKDRQEMICDECAARNMNEYLVQDMDEEYVVLLPVPKKADGQGYNITRRTFSYQRIEDFFSNIPSYDILCMSGPDSYCQLSEKIVDHMLQYNKPKAVISTIDSAFGEVQHHPVECSRMIRDDKGLLKLVDQNIRVVADTVSTIAINQLYHLSNKMNVPPHDPECESKILEYCVAPIVSYLNNSSS